MQSKFLPGCDGNDFNPGTQDREELGHEVEVSQVLQGLKVKTKTFLGGRKNFSKHWA